MPDPKLATRTDSTGHYDIAVPFDGPVEISVRHKGFALELRCARLQPFKTTEFDFELNKGGIVEGVVKFENGEPASGFNVLAYSATTESVKDRITKPDGEPAGDVELVASPLLEFDPNQSFAIINTTTDSTGFYRFTNLPSNSYRLATGQHFEFINEYWNGLGDACITDLKVSKAEPLVGVDFHLRGGVQIWGTVRETERRVEAATLLRLHGLDEHGTAGVFGFRVTDAAGKEYPERFDSDCRLGLDESVFGPLPAGNYQIRGASQFDAHAMLEISIAGEVERSIEVRFETPTEK